MASDLMIPVQCNICDTAVAKFYCNTCRDSLCTTCKAIHLKGKGTKHHKIVPYAEKLNPKYLAGLLCPKHQANVPKFWCDKCDAPICDPCITNEHKGHPFSDITVLLAQKRDEMLAEMKTLRDKNVGEWEGVLNKAKKTTTDFLYDIDEVSKELVARAKAMHKQVEAILAGSQQTLQKIKESGLTKLKLQEENLDKKLRQLKKDVARYEDQLTHGNPNDLIQFKQSGQNMMKPPLLETVSPPVFTKGQNDFSAVQTMFGQLSATAISQKSGEVTKMSSADHISSQQAVTSDKSKSNASSEAHSSSSCTKRSLILNPSVQSQFDVDTGYPRIACVEQGLAWVQTWKKLQLMDRDGQVKQTINIDNQMEAMALTSEGDLLLADYWKNCIKCVSKQKIISTLFKTDRSPWGVCCLQNDEIAVTFVNYSKVTMYIRSGEIKHTLDHVKCKYPRKIAANRVNKNIYICDKEDSSYNSPGKVIAVGADGQLCHEYTGQGDSEFTPVDVCTDQMGHILIADYDNHRLHMLDQQGQFIQYVLTREQGLCNPANIDVDNEGHVWVGESLGNSKGCVKVARYLH